MVTDLIGGQVDFATAALPSVQQHIKSGALRAIGIGGPQRTPAAPEIPTFVEQGLPGYVVEAWFAVIGPKGMTAADVKRVHEAVSAAFADPAVKEAMAKQGNIDQHQHAGVRAAVLPQRAGEVRQAGEEGRHRTAIGP